MKLYLNILFLTFFTGCITYTKSSPENVKTITPSDFKASKTLAVLPTIETKTKKSTNINLNKTQKHKDWEKLYLIRTLEKTNLFKKVISVSTSENISDLSIRYKAHYSAEFNLPWDIASYISLFLIPFKESLSTISRMGNL